MNNIEAITNEDLFELFEKRDTEQFKLVDTPKETDCDNNIIYLTRFQVFQLIMHKEVDLEYIINEQRHFFTLIVSTN